MSQFAVSDPPKGPRTSGLLDRLADLWCRSMHDSPMLPIHGRYQCRRCHRYHDVVGTSQNQTPPSSNNPTWF